ncbi:hypothetical protein C8R46DRAFT_880094 [Mycena filopes]|nr:hypothetical protein C8R46DRAFT_880094 [Mycena filopes]
MRIGKNSFYISCRRRKMKCDGVHPICGQCARAGRPEDCEYINGQRRARVEILQESISQVESRIYELENPHKKRPAVFLRQPYEPGTSRTSSPQPIRTESGATADEPPFETIQRLITTFLAYSSEFGFFLNGARFRHSALLRQPMGHYARPTPAVLSAVYLCALRLSRDANPHLTAQEPAFLSRALKFTAEGLSSPHPQKILHNLQAHVLLAYYFFACGRFLEGKYHTAAAVSLGLSSGIHWVRSTSPTLQPSESPMLPPARDAAEEGERIHACWVLVVLDRVWAVAQDEDANLDHEQQNIAVDTPWPLEMDDYANGLFSPTARYSNTLLKFVNNVPTSDTGMSTLAMLSKAAILWQRTSSLTRLWKPDMTQNQWADFHRSLAALDSRIDAFRAALIPPNRIAHPTPAMTRALVVAHSIAHTATIQLYNGMPLRESPNATRKRLTAATVVLNILVAIPLQNFGFINPIMGVRSCALSSD